MTTDLFTRLHDADPAKGMSGYDDADMTTMARIITDEADHDVAATTGAARRFKPRRLLLAIPVAATVAAALVIAPTFTNSPSVSAEAATILNKAADNITATDPAAKPGQWWKVTTSGFNLAIIGTSTTDPNAAVAILEGRTDTSYIAVDGSHATYTASGPATFVRQVGGAHVTAADLPDQFNGSGEVTTSNLAPNDTPGAWQAPTPAFLAALPRDPSALRQRLYDDTAGHGRSTDGEVFVYVADVLRSGLVPADLRGALYRVLATVPGVEITSRTATIGTAKGIAFGWYEATDGTRQEIIINPANGDLIGERDVTVTNVGDIPAGTVTGETVVTRTLANTVPADVVANAKVLNCNVIADDAIQCDGA